MQNRCIIALDKQKQPTYTSVHRKQCLIKDLTLFVRTSGEEIARWNRQRIVERIEAAAGDQFRQTRQACGSIAGAYGAFQRNPAGPFYRDNRLGCAQHFLRTIS